MKSDASWEPSNELFQRLGRLDHSTVIPVLGIPVRFESDSVPLLEEAEAYFGVWRSLERAPEMLSPASATVRLVHRDGDEGSETRPPIKYVLPWRERLIVSTPGSLCVADAHRAEAVAFITPALLESRDHFRYGVLEALTLFVLTDLDRQPLHAAALMRDGTALLMAGPTGVGKSTLTYAGVRAGLEMLAEDAVYLQSRPKPRVWGMPGSIHLLPDAGYHFPELAERGPSLRANGKEKIAVDLRETGSLPALPVVERAGICLLARGAGGPRLESLAPAQAEAALVGSPEGGFERFAATIGAAVRRLVGQGGGWRLTLASSPQTAVPFLERMLDELGEGRATD
jgi:hypothetical protein